MKTIISFILLIPIYVQAQSDSTYRAEILKFQSELNAEFSNAETSPLTPEGLENFNELEFFPINADLRITAKFIRTVGQIPFQMATTTNRLPVYEKYGEAHFTLEGKPIVLEIYQSHDLRETEEYKDYLFLPFTDVTNGKTSYGGGRYIGLTIPEGDSITIDFNKAYNPYCAYNGHYSCPKVPEQNSIPVEIKAGVMAYEGK